MMKKARSRKRKLKVGIPRGLLFYQFEAMWTTFFETLGAEVVISPETTKKIKEDGLKSTLDADCYSAKLFYGHVEAIKDEVDYFFVPRFASRKKREVGCPKFIALADILEHTKENMPPIIGPYYSTSREKHGVLKFLQLVYQIGFLFTKNPFRIFRAMKKGLSKKDEERLRKKFAKMKEPRLCRGCIIF